MIFSPLTTCLAAMGKRFSFKKGREGGGAVGKGRRREGKKAALNDNKKIK